VFLPGSRAPAPETASSQAGPSFGTPHPVLLFSIRPKRRYDVLDWPCTQVPAGATNPPTRRCARGEELNANGASCAGPASCRVVGHACPWPWPWPNFSMPPQSFTPVAVRVSLERRCPATPRTADEVDDRLLEIVRGTELHRP
jgi:hypothetical protein